MIRRFALGILESQNGWTDPLGGFIQEKILQPVFKPVHFLKDFLNGTWLGHSLHALLTDVPIGAFTAAVVARMERVSVAVCASIAIAIVDKSIFWATGRPAVGDLVMLIAIAAAMLVQRRGLSRVEESAASSWSACTSCTRCSGA